MLLFLFVSWLLACLLGFLLLHKVEACTEFAGAAFDSQTLSIIIPARNEEANLPKLLGSLREQVLPNWELIVVNDASTDSTKKIALEYKAKVIDSLDLPKGWTGKNWACHQGAAAASGQLLLFLDADTRLEKEGLRKILSTYHHLHPEGALAIFPFLLNPRYYENLSLFFNLLMAMGLGAFGSIRSRNRLCGQAMLLSRKIYFASGGHEVVKNRVLENFYLSEILQEKQIPVYVRGGNQTISIRMFPNGAKELIRGWIKAFGKGATATEPRILFFIILWITALMSTLPVFFYAIFSKDRELILVAIFMCILCSFQLKKILEKIGKFSKATTVFFWIPLLFFQAIFFRSLWGSVFGSKAIWRDRVIEQ